MRVRKTHGGRHKGYFRLGLEMTEIQERRWRCDYCGNVSPVIEQSDGLTHPIYKPRPMGWVFIPADFFEEPKTFCCAMHETLYKNKRDESAETPEVTP